MGVRDVSDYSTVAGKEFSMDDPIAKYWSLRLEKLKSNLEKNNFAAFVANDVQAARDLVLDELIPAIGPESVSWGGSMTHVQSGIYEALKNRSDLRVLDTYDRSVSPEVFYETRRQALLTDLFITGTNAITEDGALVNLDMLGNRAGAIAFGPKHVIVLAGRNKLVTDLDAAINRIKEYAAPINTMRLEKKTPCAATGYCAECSSPDRICNVWTITEKAFPKGRIRVVLINQDLGL
jgi:LUD domain